jgi:hypothetical protein
MYSRKTKFSQFFLSQKVTKFVVQHLLVNIYDIVKQASQINISFGGEILHLCDLKSSLMTSVKRFKGMISP